MAVVADHSPQDQQLSLHHLQWIQVGQLGAPAGTPRVWRLALAKDPHVDGTGVFFLWDLDEGRTTGGFIADDTVAPTVADWRQVRLASSYASSRFEVRYGDPEAPAEAAVVAGVY
ncbi:hypothetical protein C6N75_10220 [Streptomyces solincola]|uniref:Uncharacterized protein n=1 Tax=Streptomyces solincola TaxID=2100817 RepID=A0A2S9PY12_9ACTN|nr:hypothetical protein C6N75_10220 [Streptomyces solincola]